MWKEVEEVRLIDHLFSKIAYGIENVNNKPIESHVWKWSRFYLIKFVILRARVCFFLFDFLRMQFKVTEELHYCRLLNRFIIGT